jgi:hypothetical protein
MKRLLPFLLAAVVAPAVTAEARADGALGLSMGYDNRKMTREECARKAVEAMAAKHKFPFAEVTDDGNARGWNDKINVLVMSFPMPDPERVFVVVVAAGMEAAETERVRVAVMSHVCDGPYDPKAPTRVAPEGGKAPSQPCTLCWKSEERTVTNLLRHYVPAATIVLEKKGYQTKAGPVVVLGFMPDRGVTAFLAPTATALSARFNVVVATPGEASGEKAAEDLLSRIVKVLYE